MTIKTRRMIEGCIARRIVRDAIRLGYSLDVNDSEEVTLRDSTDAKAVFKALMTTDEDYLIVRKGKSVGWVRLVYGNDGWDVICDYTLNLEQMLAGSNRLAEQLEARYSK